MLGRLIILASLGVVVYNLGAGLYFMMVDKPGSHRTVDALSRRIVLSVALIVLVIVGIGIGWIRPHGIGG